MGILNRTKDASERKEVYGCRLGSVVNAVTLQICQVPYPAVLEGIYHSHQGLSSTPGARFDVWRFIGGAGFTAVQTGIGASGTVVAFATSGVIAASLPAPGSTLLNLMAGDVIMLSSFGGTGTATAESAVEVVLKKTQDIVSYFGDNS